MDELPFDSTAHGEGFHLNMSDDRGENRPSTGDWTKDEWAGLSESQYETNYRTAQGVSLSTSARTE